jgi:hypothetical protein
VGVIFVALGLFLLGAGVLGDALLPRVNEGAVLSAQILTAALTLTAPRLPGWPALAVLVGLPLAGSLALALLCRELSPPAQALVYFGYLLALLALTVQTGSLGYFSAPELGIWEAFAFGGLFIFLLLHALFAMRFFLIVSSLLLPRNRPLVGAIMPRLYSNEQVSPALFLALTGGLAGAVLLNARFGWLAPQLLASLAVAVSAQILSAAGSWGKRGV